MSSGLEFHVLEWEPGQWYWLRQSNQCPKSCWDWREEDPDVVGPFPSKDALNQSYAAHERNTGGSTTYDYTPALHQDEALIKAIATAETPERRYGDRPSIGGFRRVPGR